MKKCLGGLISCAQCIMQLARAVFNLCFRFASERSERANFWGYISFNHNFYRAYFHLTRFSLAYTSGAGYWPVSILSRFILLYGKRIQFNAISQYRIDISDYQAIMINLQPHRFLSFYTLWFKGTQFSAMNQSITQLGF